jgi:hypothetical protein
MGITTREYGPNAVYRKLTISEMDENFNYLNLLADYPVTNHFYVDPQRDDTQYEPTGNQSTPFVSVSEALAFIDAGINNGSIVPGELNPIFVILLGDTTENITLTHGHVFLTTANGSIHTPIYFRGTIHVEGGATGPSAIDANHFAITGLTVVAPTNEYGIHTTGGNAQRLMLSDVWLTASGTGAGLYAGNTGTRVSDGKKSTVHGSDIKVSHNGSGDVYCFNIQKGTADFANVETSGATQVAAVGTGASLAFTNSQLEANGEVCVEAYGSGTITVTNSTIVNTNTGVSYGIWLHQPGSIAVVGQSYFDVRSTNSASRAVHGVTGSYLFQANNLFAKTAIGTDTNRKIDAAVTVVSITGTFQTV